MRTWICATLVLLCPSAASAQMSQLPVFADDWYVLPSPDPERVDVRCGQSLRIHGLVEIPDPASWGAVANTSSVVDESSTLRLGLERGKVTTLAKVTDDIGIGWLFMPFHFCEGPANMLTIDALDPTAKIPEYKVCAATIRKAQPASYVSRKQGRREKNVSQGKA